MNKYIDVKLLPDNEMSSSAVLEKLWFKFHHYLIESGATLAVSFPGYREREQGERRDNRTLGEVMRVHGDSDALAALVACRWAKGVYDYIAVGNIADAPQDAPQCVVSRAYFMTNIERKRRRAEKRGIKTDGDPRFSAAREQKPHLPYCRIFSKSSQQVTYRFIRQVIVDAPAAGGFDTFGLSRGASVPFF